MLSDRFPHAQQFEDVRQCGAHNLKTLKQSSGPLRTAAMWDFSDYGLSASLPPDKKRCMDTWQQSLIPI
ncbi:hypothetical protein CES87_04050 [Pseudomonas sp. ERMR1:02]|nr:hypothetical protein CES87_04050 [Pseudomonas sp. ERMR1:02]